MGYETTVFESQPIGGGMLGITVPEFRLPRSVIQQEIDYIKNCGVEIIYNAPIDAKHTVDNLMEEGYSSVFIAAGAQASTRIGIQGEDENLEGIHYGLQFLTDVRAGKKIQLKGKVIVVGGGNVAIDVARTSLRMGAGEVQIVYRRTIEEMPAWKKDIEEAIEEGVIIHPLWAPKQILHEDNRVVGMEFVQSMTVYDDDGKSALSVDENSTQTIEAQTVIVSVGQAPDISFLSKDSQIERSLWGSLQVDENSLSTNISGVFAGGDFTSGPSTVIQAIAAGRRAALAIDKYIQGDKGRIKIVDEKTAFKEDAGLALDNESVDEAPRVSVELEKPAIRIEDFREVEKGFSGEAQARQEAFRCLRCDLEKEGR
jgi:NADH-quinone oxidoreductase subunit F